MLPTRTGILGSIGGVVAAIKERRRLARRPVETLVCDRGEVIDLSARGMRLRTAWRWPEGETHRVRLGDGTARLTLEARCVWCRQDAMTTHAVGLAFDGLTSEQAACLEDLARRHEPAPAVIK